MRILRIIRSASMAGGGPVAGLTASCAFLSKHGHASTVITLDPPGAPCLAALQSACGAKVLGVGPSRGKYGYSPRLANWIDLHASDFDAAVIHGLWNHASIGGWQGLRRAGLPYVIFPHGMLDPWFRKAKPVKHWVKQVFWAVQGRALRDATEVLFTSEEERRLAEGVFFGYRYSPRVVAYAAADVSPATADEGAVFRSLAPALGDRPYLLYLGRIHEKKGCDLLIEGFARAARRPELQLVMAGPVHTDLGTRLQGVAEAFGVADRVHWTGMLSGKQKAGAFRAAEAFVLTSHQENFGIAVAEALAYGKPVLISDQINIWREIESGGGGLVAPDTVEGAARLISSWEDFSPDERQAMGQAARTVYEHHFTVEAAARDLFAALQRAAHTRVEGTAG